MFPLVVGEIFSAHDQWLSPSLQLCVHACSTSVDFINRFRIDLRLNLFSEPAYNQLVSVGVLSTLDSLSPTKCVSDTRPSESS